MSVDIERLLHEGMDRFTEDVQNPPGLVGRARARVRRRKAAVRAGLAGGTAAVAAAAVLAATGGASGAPGPAVQARTAAYVIGRVEDAVAANHMVVRTDTSFTPAFPGIVQWNYRGHERESQAGAVSGQEQVNVAGGTAAIGGKQTYVYVDYRHHRWSPAPGTSLAVPSRCSVSLALAESDSADWPTYIRHLLSCGVFTKAGHAWIGGRETTKITGSEPGPAWWHGVTWRIQATLYVDPSTYLPVRLLWSNRVRTSAGKDLTGTVRQDMRYLPATPRNTARASITIPAGFREVHDASFGPVFQWFGHF